MAWVYCTKEDVNEYSGIAVSRLKDSWSARVEGLIDLHHGKKYDGTDSYSEDLDGDGTDVIYVSNTPLISVTSLSVDDVNLTSSEYKVYSAGYIRLVSALPTAIGGAIDGRFSAFPVGTKNVSITYVAGDATVPDNVRLAATAMISMLAAMHEKAGSDSSLALGMSSSGSTGERNAELSSMDLSARFNRILNNYLGQKWNFS